MVSFPSDSREKEWAIIWSSSGLYTELERNGFRLIPTVFSIISEKKVFKRYSNIAIISVVKATHFLFRRTASGYTFKQELCGSPEMSKRELQAGNFLQGDVNCYLSCHFVKGTEKT